MEIRWQNQKIIYNTAKKIKILRITFLRLHMPKNKIKIMKKLWKIIFMKLWTIKNEINFPENIANFFTFNLFIASFSNHKDNILILFRSSLIYFLIYPHFSLSTFSAVSLILIIFTFIIVYPTVISNLLHLEWFPDFNFQLYFC